MRHLGKLGRLGVIAATTALAGTAAFTGIGMAGAQNSDDWRLDSPSTVSVHRDAGGELVLSYDNRSGHDLLCHAYIGVPRTVQNLYEVHVRWGLPSRLKVIADQSDIGVIGHELSVGRGDVATFAPADGDSGPVTFLQSEEGEGGDIVLVPAPPAELSDTSFRPEVVTVCAISEEGAEWYTYAELEKSAPSGNGILGSLADLGATFGS